MDDPQIYRPPANHDNDIKKMGLYLTAGILVFVVIVILFVAFADKLAKKIPFSAEQQFVKPYEKILSKYFSDSPLPEEKAIERYISDMVADISVQMALPKDHAVKVHYINIASVHIIYNKWGGIIKVNLVNLKAKIALTVKLYRYNVT